MTDDTRHDRPETTLPPDEQPTWSPPEEVTTPVPAAPVALAGDRPPVRGRLRWGIALLVSLFVVVIAGGAFYLVTAATPTSALLADVPGDALYYVELRADLPGSQRQALAELLSGFPGFADRSQLDAKLSESVDKLLLRATDGKYDYSTQIKPWFAGQLAVAVPNLPASGNAASGVPTHLLVLATVTDATKAGDWVKSVIGSTSSTTESYGGVSLSVVTRNGHSGAFGVKGQVLLVGDLDSVKAAIDAESAGSLRDSDELKRAASALPGDHLAFVYVDNKRLLALASQNPALTGEAGQTIAELQACVTGNVSWSAGAVRADGRTLVMETATPKESEVVSRESTLSRVAPHLPASTVAVLDIHDVGKLALGIFDHCRSLPRIADALKSIDTQVNALGGYASYLGWIGDTDLVVTRSDGKPSGGVVIVPADAAGAQRVATQIRNLIALGGGSQATITDENYNGTTITTVAASSAQLAGMSHVVYAVRDDVVVVSIDSAFVKAVLDTKADSSLASNDRYKQLIGRATDRNFQQAYVDLTATREILESFATTGSAAEYEREYKPYLEPFDALVAAGWTDGDMNRGRAILQIK
jgi:Protein of unknown function (DUF3352)